MNFRYFCAETLHILDKETEAQGGKNAIQDNRVCR